MTKVKICGITSLEDALIAVDAGADALGFNFYARSPRYISPRSAHDIIAKLPKEISTVGVFVNSSLEDMEAVLSTTPLHLVQLHGDERPDFVIRLTARTGAKVIKAFRASMDFHPDMALEYDVDHFLLDADSHSFGGAGETFDWSTAVRFKKFAPQFYLAGGLTPDNVSAAIRKVEPFAVDVCSGVELTKGVKDPVKVAAFVGNAKSAL